MNAITPVVGDVQLSHLATSVPVGLIDVQPGRRRLNPTKVEALSEDIGANGLGQPITVVTSGERFRLVIGGHRLGAAKLLGWTAIPAFVLSESEWADADALKLREIAENLYRADLTALDRAFDIAAWREIYVATHVLTKRGRPRKERPEDAEKNTGEFASNFSSAAKAMLKMDESTVFKHLKIASIGQELRERISLHPIADNQSELLQLAREPAERRDGVVALLLAEPAQAATVSEAIAILDRAPVAVAPMRWEKLSAGFSRLKEHEQFAFVQLHEEPIRAWLAELDKARGPRT